MSTIYDSLEEYRIYRNIICIDLKSFFASVECADLNLDPFKVPLVVADIERGQGTICLALSPYLRQKGLPGRLRVFELPKGEEYIFRKPRMRRYLEMSAKIVSIYLKYVSKEDIHIYSVDECFLDFTDYRKMYSSKSMMDIAKMIVKEVYDETHIYATAGIGPNMLLAKLAMDNEAKKNKSQIAEWNYEDVPTKLWNITPLSKMWGIGRRYEKRLNDMGFRKVGDIAASTPDKLRAKFGVLGEELWYHTNGIDQSLIQDKKKYRPISRSFSVGQVLFQDYYRDTAPQIILEMSDTLAERLRAINKKVMVVHLGVGYNRDSGYLSFSRQKKLSEPINLGSDIAKVCMSIFDKYYHDEPIRRIHIAVSGLTENQGVQLSLFEDNEKKIKEEMLSNTLDKIKRKYGKNSVRRASTELEHSTAKSRNKQIGGHNG